MNKISLFNYYSENCNYDKGPSDFCLLTLNDYFGAYTASINKINNKPILFNGETVSKDDYHNCTIKPMFNDEYSLNYYFSSSTDEARIYGNYPQFIVNSRLQKKLEDEFKKNKLIITGKEYTYNKSLNDYKIDNLTEYEDRGRKYVRVLVNNDVILSDNKVHNKGEYVWIEVSPVKWVPYIANDKRMFISEYDLIGSIKYDEINNYLGSLENDMFNKIDKEKNILNEMPINSTNEMPFISLPSKKEMLLLEKNPNISDKHSEYNCYRDYNNYHFPVRGVMYDTDIKELYILSKRRELNYDEQQKNGMIYPVINNVNINMIKNNMSSDNTIYFGEYPQELASIEEQKYLDLAFNLNKLETTKEYFKVKSISFDKNWLERGVVYLYNNQKIIRVFNSRKNDGYLWIKVEPIKWIFDERNKVLVCTSILDPLNIVFNGKNDFKHYHDMVYSELNNLFSQITQCLKVNKLDKNRITNYINNTVSKIENELLEYAINNYESGKDIYRIKSLFNKEWLKKYLINLYKNSNLSYEEAVLSISNYLNEYSAKIIEETKEKSIKI